MPLTGDRGIRSQPSRNLSKMLLSSYNHCFRAGEDLIALSLVTYLYFTDAMTLKPKGLVSVLIDSEAVESCSQDLDPKS